MSYGLRIPIWTHERIERGCAALRAMTPADLCKGRDPDVTEYILELRRQAEMWKRLYNQRLQATVKSPQE